MKTSRKLKFALNFTRYNIIPIHSWVPEQNSSKIQRVFFELAWWLMFMCSLMLLFPLLAAAYKYRDNSEIMTKSVCLSCAVSQCTIKIIFCRMRRTELKRFLKEIEDFIKYSSDSDRETLMKFVSQCTVLHLSVAIWVYMTGLSFIIVPFVNSRMFPTDAVYPFSVENTFVRIIIYINQSCVAVQVVAAVLFDCLVAMLLWFACARFVILASSISDCNSFETLKKFIQQHQYLLRYTVDLNNTISIFLLATLMTSIGGVLFSAIQLVSKESLTVKGQYAIVAVTAILGLFTCSWAADSLIQTTHLVGIKAFQSKWYNMEKRSQTCFLRLITQSQVPVKFKANNMLPNLSLALFSQFLLTSFKIFTSLRIIVG